MFSSFTNIIVVIIASKEGWPIGKLKVQQWLSLELTIIGKSSSFLECKRFGKQIRFMGFGKGTK
jgi:hypothetical protein